MNTVNNVAAAVWDIAKNNPKNSLTEVGYRTLQWGEGNLVVGLKRTMPPFQNLPESLLPEVVKEVEALAKEAFLNAPQEVHDAVATRKAELAEEYAEMVAYWESVPCPR